MDKKAKEEKIKLLEKTFTRKDNTKTGWATLVLKSQTVPLESFRTKWEFTEWNAKVGFIMKGYVWGMTEEIFEEFKTYISEYQKDNKADMTEKVKELFEFFDKEFEVVITDTTEDKK